MWPVERAHVVFGAMSEAAVLNICGRKEEIKLPECSIETLRREFGLLVGLLEANLSHLRFRVEGRDIDTDAALQLVVQQRGIVSVEFDHAGIENRFDEQGQQGAAANQGRSEEKELEETLRALALRQWELRKRYEELQGKLLDLHGKTRNLGFELGKWRGASTPDASVNVGAYGANSTTTTAKGERWAAERGPAKFGTPSSNRKSDN